MGHAYLRTPKKELANLQSLTFRLTSDSTECKIYEIAGKTVIYSFASNFVDFALSDVTLHWKKLGG